MRNRVRVLDKVSYQKRSETFTTASQRGNDQHAMPRKAHGKSNSVFVLVLLYDGREISSRRD
jgi:hypothetical protein